ncbi:YkvA family protein [Alkalimarinus alittae]|uniref:YkvA family protein n=1 Tax=Alkalimarinus alittae TaxID=2961619 RepID=A0ABY6MZH4_9ALTE|nr:YkvA family protein [Alkalimarinus alittae]UZE95185.1 YkvA family protein [Alkalimarinus alittae]
MSNTENNENNENTTIQEKVPERSFWKKIKHNASMAGYEAVYNAFILYYTARAEETPLWCKTVIAGALGYFISLIDAIPDLTPILGYTDDVAVMVAAIGALAAHITPEIKQKAKDKSDQLLKK